MGPETFDDTIKNILSGIFGSWGVYLLVGLLMVIFQSSIKDIAFGITWRLGSGFRKNNIVNLNGEYARITHMGLFKTEFTVYDWDSAKEYIVAGESFPIPNSKLKDMNIRIPLPLVDKPKELRKAIK